tara:strand:+ start:203 stop:646 length:444 start_codon:yes stop_codon:yes gene_type:complete
MKTVLKKMLRNGFNPTYSPPHSCSVYILQNVGKDKEQFGLSRTDPTILQDSDKNTWVDSALFELDNGRDEETHPIGAFIGFVTESPKKEDTYIFVGILVSPTGEEMVGHYIPLSNLSSTPLNLWDSPEYIFPFLQSNYIPSTSHQKH